MANSGRTIPLDSTGKVQSIEADDTQERLNRLAWLLDSSIRIPGTRFTIGADALIGLIPFVGDLIGVLLSSYIVSEAARLGAPRIVLARMVFNIGIEGLVGIVPFAGDVFDAAWKANQRNVRLLNSWVAEPVRIRRSSSLFAAILLTAVITVLAGLAVAGFLALRWVLQQF